MSVLGSLGIRPGCWWFASKADPRWNKQGHVETLSVTAMPPEAQKALDELKEQLGEPPEDLEYGCLKD